MTTLKPSWRLLPGESRDDLYEAFPASTTTTSSCLTARLRLCL